MLTPRCLATVELAGFLACYLKPRDKEGQAYVFKIGNLFFAQCVQNLLEKSPQFIIAYWDFLM